MPGRKLLLLCAFALAIRFTFPVNADCPIGDVHQDADCQVNWLDLRDFAERWLDAGCSAPACGADLDGVPGVTMKDYALLADNWMAEGTYTLVINEFMADNAGTIEDPDESGEYADWFEIYNYGSEDIDVGGMYVKDDTTWWRIPTGYPLQTTVKAHRYLLVWADNDPEQGPLHVDFALGRGSDQVGIYDAFRYPIDVITFTNQIEDRSRGRLPDGSSNWITFEIGSATPGTTNRGKPVEVVINEIMYHPGHAINTPENIGQEYIELYNNGEEPIGLLGWRFTNGVDYTVTDDVIIGVGGYYVIAANVDAFKAKYPTVTNVVGGWVGRLSNSGETVELVDNVGVLMDKLEYADQGDWAVRELGPVDFEHRGWQWSDDHDGGGKSLELINPGVANEFGQNWAASRTNGGTPGALNTMRDSDIAPLILDVGHFPIIPGADDPVTVTAQIIDELTTGVTATLLYRLDGGATFNTIAMFDDGAHGDGGAGDRVYAGQIPAQADGEIVEFYVRAGDAAANFRTWPAPSNVDGTPQQVTNALYQVDNSYNADAPWLPGSQPVYYIIMTEAQRAELEDIGDDGDPFWGEGASDAQMNATFISVDGMDTKVRYRVGVRNRGNRTRVDPPNNYRVNFVNDDPWKDVTALNINSKYPHLQLMGSVLFRLAGLPAPVATAIQLRVNGENLAADDYGRTYNSYVALEAYNSEWAENHFPDDPDGSLYRCTYVVWPSDPTTYADLYYKETPGTTPDPDDYDENYDKQTNTAQYDYSDLFGLIDTLNNTSIPASSLLTEVNQVANLEMWMRYIATDAFAGNREGGLYEGEGDDYAMYCGVEDPRFWLLPHDLDTLLGQGDHSFRPDWGIFDYANVRGLQRLFAQNDAWKGYYSQYKDLGETIFSPEDIYPVIDQMLGSWVPNSEIEGANGIKQFVAERLESLLYGGYPNIGDAPQIPQGFSIACDLSVISGFYQTNGSTVASGAIHGTANAIDTSSVIVNGRAADWAQRYGTWEFNQAITLFPGINRIAVQAFDGPNGTGSEIDSGYIDIWRDDGNVSPLSGTLATSRILDAASGPWHVTADVTVPAGVTLTIMPGATIFFEPNTKITINGLLVAEGSQYELIRFTRTPGLTGTWAGLQFVDTMDDNRIAYAVIEYGQTDNGMVGAEDSNLTLDHVTLDNAERRRIRTLDSSLIVRNCLFTNIFDPGQAPLTDNMSEHIWGRAPTAGWFIIENNVFGLTPGHNDAVDVDGPSRPNSIVQILNNVFQGGGDDALDLEGDAHIEGNLFANYIRDQWNNASGESNVISAGAAKHYVMVRNFFYNTQHVAQVKNGAFLTFVNNTVVDACEPAIYFDLGLPGRDPGRGAYVEGIIFWNTPEIFAGVIETTDLTVNYSMLPVEWHYLGVGNIDADPVFVDPNGDFHLEDGSGAIGTGAWGLDMGAYVPAGAAISGEPPAVTYHTGATLTVGGPGITHYKYSVNSAGGPWTGPFDVNVPVVLTGLVNGQPYTVYAIGMNSAGVWQSEETAAASHTWTIDTSHTWLVINEVLAHTHGNDPDIIELYYDGPVPIDLTGMSLTDNPIEPNKFEFSPSTCSRTVANPGDYIILYGDLTTVQDHLGFALLAEGEGLYLYDKPKPDGSRDLLDSVEFGQQMNDYSIGRVGWDRRWKLNQITFGSANIPQALGDIRVLKINEWLADGELLFADDFIELYNPRPLPVELSGLFLTDNPVTQKGKHRIVPLSFIEPKGSTSDTGYAVFQANDGNDPWELGFKLSGDGEMIGLFDEDLNMIDQVLYGPQTTDVSQSRAPDGSSSFGYLELPTPGVANTFGTYVETVFTLVPEDASKVAHVPTSADDVGPTWNSDPGFYDSTWLQGIGSPGGVGFERNTGYEDFISIDVETPMYNKNETCYIRIPFTVADADLPNFKALMLKIRYDDGFVAYINGAELTTARRNFTGTPEWNSGADGGHADSQAVLFEYIDVSAYIDALKAGDNILAIQGLNDGLTSSDFLISAELDVTSRTIDEEYPFFDDLNVLAGLRVTELMHHAPQGSNYDYIEFRNISDIPIDLEGVRIAEAVEYVFPDIQLDPGRYIVVVRDLAAFRSIYGAGPNVAAGAYLNDFSNGSEDVVVQLAWPLEAAVMRFEYSDAWYPTTDGGGDSLTINDATAEPYLWNEAESWHAAAPSPGEP